MKKRLEMMAWRCSNTYHETVDVKRHLPDGVKDVAHAICSIVRLEFLLSFHGTHTEISLVCKNSTHVDDGESSNDTTNPAMHEVECIERQSQ